MKRILALSFSAALLAAVSAPAFAEGGCGAKQTVAASQQTQQTAQAQTGSNSVTR
jgi:hypothetical protein